MNSISDADLKAQVARALLVDELRLAELRVRERALERSEAVRARDSLVLQAISEGIRPAEVARICGLSRNRIKELQHR